MVEFDIVLMGYFRNPIKKNKLKEFDSSIFTIIQITEQRNFEVENWHEVHEVDDASLSKYLKSNTFSRTTLIICDKPLEGNWYLRILNEKVVVLSLYQISNILLDKKIPLEDFILKTLIKNAVIYHFYGKKLSTDAYENSHYETRKCIFDFNIEKTDVIYNTQNAILCDDCCAKFDKKVLPEKFKDKVKSDLEKIKKNLYYVIEDFVKERPVLSLGIASVFGVLLNIVASYMFDYFKYLYKFPFQG